MSRVLLSTDPHAPGRHCASSALRDVAHYSGHALSEAMCFGLGAGLGFVYLEGGSLSPSRLFHCRSPDLEGTFFRRLGIDFRWRTTADARSAWEEVRILLDQGIPVLVQTDLRCLPYYRSRTHFTGHVICIWGYDEDQGVAYVADTHFPGLQAIALDDLAAARTSSAPPCPLSGNYFPGALPAALPPLAPLVRAALEEQATTMLAGVAGSEPAAWGVAGMRTLETALPEWPDAPDVSWCARFAYQVIERRGTGGGGFRFVYRDFLREAQELCPELRASGLPRRMEEVATAWSELAMELKKLSEKPERNGFVAAAALVAGIARAEEDFWTDVLATPGSHGTAGRNPSRSGERGAARPWVR